MTPTATLKRQLRRLRQARSRWKQRGAAKQLLIRSLRVRVRDLVASRDLWKGRCSALQERPRPAAAPAPALLPLPRPADPTGPHPGGL